MNDEYIGACWRGSACAQRYNLENMTQNAMLFGCIEIIIKSITHLHAILHGHTGDRVQTSVYLFLFVSGQNLAKI